jgi:hypothetical protein
MGGQRHTERSRAPRHPSEATINLCWQFGEELTRERDNLGGGGWQKRVEVEETEWRSLHLHSINSKPTFRPPQCQCRERTGTYSACVLGARLRYWGHSDYVYWWWKRGLLGVIWSVFREGGFGPCSFHFGFRSVLIKIYISKPYNVRNCSGFLFRGDISFRKNDWYQSEGGVNDR